VRRPRVALGAVAAVLALGVVAVAWLQDVPKITASDAVDATEAALEEAGLEAEVEPEPQRTTYASRTRDPIDVWAVRVTVRSEPIELQLALAGAHPVVIDDRAADGSRYVLSEIEYEAIADNVEDPAWTRRLERNIWLTIAAALVLALVIAHAVKALTEEPRR